MMNSRRIISVAVVLGGLSMVYAWTALPVADDPLVRMPGTQPAQGVSLEAPDRCFNCHEDPSKTPPVTIGPDWQGSMMAQAARDPIFWACKTVALQDSIWALGNANAGDLCERCHFPEGWLAGRSDPPNASLMTGSDYDGIHCDFCHQLWDPFFETTYEGLREGSDWINYWDEAGNTGPGSGTLSQTNAAETYTKDVTLAADIKQFHGGDFFTKANVPQYPSYTENASGQFFVSPGGEKRASFADANATHKMLYSRYHKSKFFCATCHDVSNPALANLGLSGLPDQSGGTALISEQYSAFRYFHVERTYSEFRLSAYGAQGGAPTNTEFAQRSGGITWVTKCQDCHMFDTTARGCNKNNIVLRPEESAEHPNSGMPRHDMTGGNSWISYILGTLDPTVPEYDPVNVSILDQGPSVLTLDLNAGHTPKAHGQKLLDGAQRAKDQLRLAASIKDISYYSITGDLAFKVQNHTAHKLISGFPEGRRMFVNIKAYNGTSLIYEANPYDYTVGTLKGLPHAASSPPLAGHESYVDELVYEVHPKSELTGEDETFHFVLATGRYKDNRIPPKGFDIASASERICQPVWHGEDAPDYFTSEEYAGGYDHVEMAIAPFAERIEIVVYYQGTSREYVEFLRDEINGVGSTLTSPTPSGEPQAYVIQTDPFFSQLKAWGNAIWDLWHHNHGLDGSGKSVEGIVPIAMTQAFWDNVNEPSPCDFDLSGTVDLVDLAYFTQRWLMSPCNAGNDYCDGCDLNHSGRVDLVDWAIFCNCW